MTRRYEPTTDAERTSLHAVELALRAEQCRGRVEAAQLLRREIEAAYMDAIDRSRAAPRDARAELETTRWGEAFERIKHVCREAEHQARQAALEADAALDMMERGRAPSARRR